MRHFAATQLFTDGNIYMVKMDMLQDAVRVLTYDERAVLLAAAITIDNDYFSRHSRAGAYVPKRRGMGE
jgi:hypothetical protein